MRKYAIKFFTSLILIIPVLVLIYIVPITNPDFITAHNATNGVPLYVFLNAFFATIIQVVMGSQFYVSSYKALKNKSANMDVLIMIGTTAAWLYGIVNIGLGYDELDMRDPHMFKMVI